MRILLVNPRSRSNIRGPVGAWPPIWAARLSAALKAQGFLDVGLLDTAANPLSDRALRSVIAADPADLIVVGSAAGAIEDALHLIEAAKGLHPEAVSLLHGVHVASTPRRLLAEAPWIDVVAEDHDYGVVVEVAQSIDRGGWLGERREVESLAFAERGGSHPLITVARPQPPRSAERPDWSLLDWDSYIYQPLNRRCATLDLGADGYVRCGLCGRVSPDGTHLNRDADSVVEEIGNLFKTYDVRFFRLNEAGGAPDSAELGRFCEVLIERGLAASVSWGMTMSAGEVIEAESALALYRKAGLLHLTLAPERAKGRRGEGVVRVHRRADARQAIRLLREADVVAELQFDLTLEQETLRTVDENLRLALDCRPDLVSWRFPEPLPATRRPSHLAERLECLDMKLCDVAIRSGEAPGLERAVVLESVLAAHKKFRDEQLAAGLMDGPRTRYINQYFRATVEAALGPQPSALGTIPYWDVDPPAATPEGAQPASDWLSPGARISQLATEEAPAPASPDLEDAVASQATSQAGGATLHPLAVVKLIEALRISGLDRFVQPIFNAAGEGAWPARPPAMPIDERRLARVHQSLRALLMPELARQVLACAGRLTADEIIEARISRRVQGLAALLPSVIADRLLVHLFRRHSGAVMGSGRFAARAGQPTVLERMGNPLCAGVRSETPICAFHTAVFRQLFRVFVSRSVEVVETQCEACGDSCCRFVVAWGSAHRQKKMFARLGIDPNHPGVPIKRNAFKGSRRASRLSRRLEVAGAGPTRTPRGGAAPPTRRPGPG